MVRQKCFLCKVEPGEAGSEGISFHSFNVEVYPSSSSSKTWSASPATVTASENCYESDVFTESVQAKKKRKRKRYVGDLTSSDFSTPEKRKRNFRLMKDTILRQRKLL
ncbi:unnamed protein product [Acanthoscelides obtectus]|uniref:Uncharacterized protein n=1 Tax=Acanthoscelides obtectus TaxID=200917 RepID=A0A9P0PA97_ACAOB|nr:unnamed protein product [Acanthoscelides obtectus]CAK1623688.1 hypothetical protein AOBTE_LOCUS2121 [Acanthoscelides obtectus]